MLPDKALQLLANADYEGSQGGVGRPTEVVTVFIRSMWSNRLQPCATIFVVAVLLFEIMVLKSSARCGLGPSHVPTWRHVAKPVLCQPS